jgi:hypothetical protein
MSSAGFALALSEYVPRGIEAEFGGFFGSLLKRVAFRYADGLEVIGQCDVVHAMAYPAAVTLNTGSLEGG